MLLHSAARCHFSRMFVSGHLVVDIASWFWPVLAVAVYAAVCAVMKWYSGIGTFHVHPTFCNTDISWNVGCTWKAPASVTDTVYILKLTPWAPHLEVIKLNRVLFDRVKFNIPVPCVLPTVWDAYEHFPCWLNICSNSHWSVCLCALEMFL